MAGHKDLVGIGANFADLHVANAVLFTTLKSGIKNASESIRISGPERGSIRSESAHPPRRRSSSGDMLPTTTSLPSLVAYTCKQRAPDGIAADVQCLPA